MLEEGLYMVENSYLAVFHLVLHFKKCEIELEMIAGASYFRVWLSEKQANYMRNRRFAIAPVSNNCLLS
jgi:hypothetical protein